MQDGKTAFHLACQAGHLDVIKLLLNQTGTNVLLNETVMWEAIENGQVSLVRRCLSSGVNINVQTKTGSTPLRKAVLSEDFRMVSVFVQNQADLNLQDEVISSMTFLV